MRDLVFYWGGGSMRAVFGAGVATGLQEARDSERVYSRVKMSEGCSGGAFDEAYWISGQTRIGSSIYYEDLPSFFINRLAIIPAFASRLWKGKKLNSSNGNLAQVVDIDGLMNVVKTKKVLDVDAINQSEIPSFVKVMDVNLGKVDYISLKGDVLRNLKRAAHLFPYYFDPLEGDFLDGGLFEVIGYDRLRERFPNDKIIFIVNYQIEGKSRHFLKSFLEGMIANRMFPNRGFSEIIMSKEKRFEEDIEKILSDSKALLVFPPKDSPSTQSTTDPQKLKITYKMGIDASRKILNWI